MTYACKATQLSTNFPQFSVVLWLDICLHPCIQALNIIFDNDETWWVINFYYDICIDTSMQALLAININALIPTMFIGNFNTDSQTWSLPGTTHSHYTAHVEEWAAQNLLELANTLGVITRKGANYERDAVLNLAWYNKAAIQAATFTNLKILYMLVMYWPFFSSVVDCR